MRQSLSLLYFYAVKKWDPRIEDRRSQYKEMKTHARVFHPTLISKFYTDEMHELNKKNHLIHIDDFNLCN